MRPFNMADPFGMFERHRALTGPQDRLERDTVSCFYICLYNIHEFVVRVGVTL